MLRKTEQDGLRNRVSGSLRMKTKTIIGKILDEKGII